MKDPLPRMKPKEPIPDFKSREEEAEFWDTHDLADYWDEFKTAKALFAKTLSEGLYIPLDSQTLRKLRSRARERRVRPATLARTWIKERLRKEEERQTAGAS